MKQVTTEATRRIALASFLSVTLGVYACASAKDDVGSSSSGAEDDPGSTGDGPAGVAEDDELASGGAPSASHGDTSNADSAGNESPVVTPTAVPGQDETFDPLDQLPGQVNDGVDGGSDDQACASTSAAAELQELALAFAFDVSGSMGEGDLPYHNKELKWDPVVAATEAFFESPDVVRVSASMVFFPTEDENRCDSELYATPDVPLQQLPSTAFGDAINEIFPSRGGTPTLAVLQATIAHVEGLIEGGSSAKHAIVLITDGMPQGCTEDADSVDAVAAAVAAVSDRVPVYVVGIANPPTEAEPNPPDNVSDLHQIAQAGGTESAFLIDTGNPTKTVTDFDGAIQAIRASGVSCELAIPDAPSGMEFDKEKVNVSLTADAEVSELIYSEDCSEQDAWHYDDVDEPSRIVLCEQTCDLTKTYADVALEVEFGCQRRMASVK